MRASEGADTRVRPYWVRRCARMTLNELRELATARFGPRLERADPDSLADFLLELQPRLPGTQQGGPITVEGAAPGYAEAMQEYFAETLYGDPERIAASLWVTAVEMWVDAVRSLDEGRP